MHLGIFVQIDGDLEQQHQYFFCENSIGSKESVPQSTVKINFEPSDDQFFKTFFTWSITFAFSIWNINFYFLINLIKIISKIAVDVAPSTS